MTITSPRGIRMRAAIAAIGAAVLVGMALAASPATASDDSRLTAKDVCVRTLAVGASIVAVPFGGTTYDVRVHAPESRPGTDVPLVLDLHGSNNNARLQSDISNLRAVADAEGFIVANPQGAIAFPVTLPDGNWAWNVPGVPLTSGTNPPAGSRDDVGFLRAVVATLDAAGCVDNRRVYATGYSGGGRMTSALACEAADIFAAIAPVAGLRAGRTNGTDLTQPDPTTCTPSEPVAVVTFHGTSDVVNPYRGNADTRWGYSVQSAAVRWAQINGCRVGPKMRQISASVVSYDWVACTNRGDVTLYEVTGGGHTWPGSTFDLGVPALGVTTQEINASQVMWDFFSKHRKR